MQLELLNDWQHGFPLVREPFAHLAARAATDEASVIGAFAAAQREGSLSRIGGVFGAGAGGAAVLAAMAVPTDRLEAVAAIASAHPGVNHNYEREHAFNLWFVMTGRDRAAVHAAMAVLEAAAGLPALRLPMLRAYRIDLGFDLHGRTHAPRVARRGMPVEAADRALAALVEAGLPLVRRPFDTWAGALRRPADDVLATIGRWLDAGTLKRFGTVVRHHELGFSANAMAVFDVPDDAVDACGALLAQQPGVTLAYRRERAPGWPYNLFAMVHGRERGAVTTLVDAAAEAAGVASRPRAVLFSCRRFKQTGARYFRSAVLEPADAAA